MANLETLRWLTVAASVTLLVGCASGPATREVLWHSLAGGEGVSSSKQARLTTETSRDLRTRGYMELGGLTVEQVVERCDWGSRTKAECKPVSHARHATADLLEEAARRGGELVWLAEDRAEHSRENGGTRCLKWDTQTQVSYRSVTGGMEYARETQTTCGAWEKYLAKDKVRRSSGVLYRYDPKRAAEQATLALLSEAVMSGDEEKIKKLLDGGARADTVDMGGVPVVGWAAVAGDERLVDLLLSRGARVDADGSLGTPLNMAARAGQEGAVRFLLKKGARLDSRDGAGNTPLFSAAEKGHTRMVRLLLDAGADPDAKNGLGNTPLVAAILGRSGEKPKLEVGGDLVVQDPEIVRLLLAKGANPRATNKANRIPAESAVMMAPASAAARFFIGYWFGATGYIDRTGKWVIKPQFRGAGDFHEGLAAVTPKGLTGGAQLRWGFIDRTGKMVIPVRFENVGIFSQGVAPAARDGGKWGFIDKTGQWVIEPQYELAGHFVDGLAPVKPDKNHWIFINRQGKQVFPDKFTFAGPFRDGVARVLLANQFGFIDKTGKSVLKQAPDGPILPLWFSEGVGAVTFKGGLVGYVDKAGKTVIPPAFKMAGDFHEGFAPVVGGGTLSLFYKYIDRTGKVVLDHGWTEAKPFSEGVAMVMNKFGPLSTKLGKREVVYIDKQGKAVLTLDGLSDPTWEWGEELLWTYFSGDKRAVFAGSFSEGLVRVRVLGDKFLSLWEKGANP